MNQPSASASILPPRLQSILWVTMLVALLTSVCVLGSVGAIAALVLSLFALPLLLEKNARQALSGQWGIYAFVSVFVMLAAIFAVNANEFADLQYTFNFIAFPLAVPTFLLARKYAGGRWPLVIVSLALLGTFFGLGMGLYEVLILGNKRAMGLVNNPNMYGHVALLFGFIAIVGVNLANKPWRFVYLSGPVAGIVTALISGSRGTLISAVPLLIIAFIYLTMRASGRRWILGTAIALSIMAAGWAFSTGTIDRQVSRIMSTRDVVIEVLATGQSTEWGTFMRIELYRGAWRAFTESPIIGHGWADANPQAASQIEGRRPATNRLNSRIAATWPHMHNDFLGFAAAAGIFGIFGYFSLLAAPFAGIRRSAKYAPHRLYMALTLSMLTAIHGLFEAPFGIDIGVITYAMLTAIIAGVFMERDAPASAEN